MDAQQVLPSPKTTTPAADKPAASPSARVASKLEIRPQSGTISHEETTVSLKEIVGSIMAIPIVFTYKKDGIVMHMNGTTYKIASKLENNQYTPINVQQVKALINKHNTQQPFISYGITRETLSHSVYRVGVTAEIPKEIRAVQAMNIIVHHLQAYVDDVTTKTDLLGYVQKVTIKANNRKVTLLQNGADLACIVSECIHDFDLANCIMYLSNNTPEYRQYINYIATLSAPTMLFEPTTDKKIIKRRRKNIKEISKYKEALTEKFKVASEARRAAIAARYQHQASPPPARVEKLPPISELEKQ